MNKFKKLLTTSVFLSFLTVPAYSAPEHKHLEILGGELLFGAGVQSQYVSKGVDENSDRPAYSLSTTFERSFGFVDFYVGYSTISATGDNYSREDARKIGFTKDIADFTFEIGLAETLKHGNRKNNQNNDVDFVYGLTFQPEKAAYSIGLLYTVNDTGGAKTETKGIKDKNYKEIKVGYDFDLLSVSASYGEQQNDREIKTLSLSKSFMDTDFTLSYIDADRKHTESALNRNRDYLVFSLAKEF